MRKILAFAICVIIIAAAGVPVLAHFDNDNIGTIPRTETAPVIDGVRDAIYDEGLHIPVRNPHSNTPDGGLGGGADAWLLWDDEALYIFMQVDVVSFFSPDFYEQIQVDAPWELTTVEVLIDFSNQGTANSYVFQFRLNDRGFPNVTPGAENPVLHGEDALQFAQTASVRTDNSYTAEFRIDLAAVAASGVYIGSPIAAGKAIGLYLFSQEIHENGDEALFISNPTDRSGNWQPDLYDYVILGDMVVGAAPAEPEPEPADDAPAPAEAEVTPAVAAAEADKPAPPTADPVTLLVLGSLVSAAGIAAVARKNKRK